LKQLLIPVRVQTGSSKRQIEGLVDGRVRIRTNAPPADGRANKDVARQLANAFQVPPSRVTLKAGARSRNKSFVVTDPAFLPTWVEDAAFR